MKFKVLLAVLVVLLAACGEKAPGAAAADVSSPSAVVQAGNGKRLALVIGNQDYVQAGAGLSRPVADAEAVAAVLRQHFTLLDDKVHTNLGKEGMENVLSRFAQAAAGADVALVYYAGHGVQDKNVNYLVPVDAEINSVAQIKYKAVDLGLMLDELEGAKTHLNLVFLDACRNNPFAGGRSLSRGLARVTPAGDSETLISYSTSEGNVAADDSLYSPALAKLIQQQPNQPIEMLLKQVGAEVKQKSNNAQRPDYTSSVTSTFCFGGCQQVATPTPLPTPPVAQQPATPTPIAVPAPAPAAPTRQAFEPEMVAIPAGRFTMGCDGKRDDVEGGCDSDEKPEHKVSISAFQMAKTETTVAQFRDFVDATGYKTTAEEKGSCYGDKTGKGGWGYVDGNSWRKLGFEQTDDDPVACVSWDDAQAYLKWLNKESGKSYRLPSEAEWEYAARGGKDDSAYPWGNKASHEFANYGKDQCCSGLASDKDEWVNTSPVGRFAANGYGLYDMHGNVWEWCQDWYDSGYYASSPASNPQGGDHGTGRVLRGGSWYYDALFVRSAYRSSNAPDDRRSLIGFRLASGRD